MVSSVGTNRSILPARVTGHTFMMIAMMTMARMITMMRMMTMMRIMTRRITMTRIMMRMMTRPS